MRSKKQSAGPKIDGKEKPGKSKPNKKAGRTIK
jgi:hypothetical protein